MEKVFILTSDLNGLEREFVSFSKDKLIQKAVDLLNQYYNEFGWYNKFPIDEVELELSTNDYWHNKNQYCFWFKIKESELIK